MDLTANDGENGVDEATLSLEDVEANLSAGAPPDSQPNATGHQEVQAIRPNNQGTIAFVLFQLMQSLAFAWLLRITTFVGVGAASDADRRERQGSGETIPPEVWAQILEYCTYDDVARMARVSTAFLRQVMPMIRTLYIDSEGGPLLTVQHARRFQGGQLDEIIFDCVFSRFVATTTEGFAQSEVTAFDVSDWLCYGKLASFLSALPGIRTVLLGKGVGETKSQILRRLSLKESIQDGARTYNDMGNFGKLQIKSFHDGTKGYFARCGGDIFPSETETFSALIRSLCNAYKTGGIPQSMHIYGLPAVHNSWDDDDGDCIFRERCTLCNEMCQTFPLDQVVSLSSACVNCYFPNKLGNNVHHKLDSFSRRKGAEEMIKKKQATLFQSLLQQVEVQILEFERGDTMAIYYERPVMYALCTLKRNGYNANALEDANMLVTDACARAFRGVATSSDFSGQFRRKKLIFIMEKDFRALVDYVGVSLDEGAFKLISETDPNLHGTWGLSG